MSDTTDQSPPDTAPTSDAAPHEVAAPEAVPMAEEPKFDPVAERKKIKAERRALLLKSPAFIAGSLILAFWALCAIAPGLLTTYGPTDFNAAAGPQSSPGSDAWFGTTDISWDVYTRVIYGARSVLIVAPVAAIFAVAAGTLLGLVTGYFRGIIDEIISRIIEALLSIPVILLGIMVLTIFGRTRLIIILAIAVLFTPVVTRTVRSAVMSEAQLDYVTSAKLRGEGSLFIMVREILPNITGVIVVELTVRIGYAIFTVATLAFLGLTSDDSTAADWGVDVANRRQGINQGFWWGSMFPAFAIASLVIAVNLIADSIDRVNKA